MNEPVIVELIGGERLPVRTVEGDFVGHYLARKKADNFMRITVPGGLTEKPKVHTWMVVPYRERMTDEWVRTLCVPEADLPLLRKLPSYEPIVKVAMSGTA